jgi:hypothetical protein
VTSTMPSVSELEKLVNNKVESWGISDITKILEMANSGNDSVMKCFSDHSTIADICGRGSQSAKDSFGPILALSDVIRGISAVEKRLRAFQGDGDRKSLISDLEAMMSDQDIMVRLPSYLAAISMFSDYDVKAKYAVSVSEDLKAIESRLEEIPPDSGHDAALRMLDLIYPLRTKWFYRYGDDPMPAESDAKLKAYQAKVDAFTLFVNEVQGNKIKFPDPHKTLHDLGVIDPADIANLQSSKSAARK